VTKVAFELLVKLWQQVW